MNGFISSDGLAFRTHVVTVDSLGAASISGASFANVGNLSTTGWPLITLPTLQTAGVYVVRFSLLFFITVSSDSIAWRALIDNVARAQPTFALGAATLNDVRYFMGAFKTPLGVGAHTFQMQWKMFGAGTGNIGGAGGVYQLTLEVSTAND